MNEIFRLGAYYRRKAGGPAYRCEAVTGYRALLYLCVRLKSEIGLEPRLLVHPDEFSDWEPITSHTDFVHLEKIYNHYLAEEFKSLNSPYDGLSQRQYHVDKYLDPVGDEDKRERHSGLVNNLVWVNRDGTRENLSAVDGGLKFLEGLAHLDEDARIRGKCDGLYGKSHVIPIKEHVISLYPYVDDIISDLPDTEQAGIYKFAKAEHARALFFHGRARVSLAGHFKKAEHNAAVRDEREDSILVRVSPHSRPLNIMKNNKPLIRSDKIDGHVLAVELSPNFPSYLYCVTKMCDPRYFFDFDCDAYVLIPNSEIPEFAKRLEKAVRKALAPRETKLFGRDVIYYDPLRVCDEFPEKWGNKLLVETHKDFKYEYQREYRFIFPIPQPGSPLPDTIDVKMEPLRDIAKLFVLKASRKPEDEEPLPKAVA